MAVAPLLLWLATYGVDPNLVLTETSDPRAGGVFGQELVSTSSSILSRPRRSANSGDPTASGNEMATASAQTAQATPGDVIIMPAEPFIWNQQAFDEFMTEMNPLVPLAYRTLDGYYDPYSWQASYGSNGFQPWRLGWVSYNDLTFLPNAPVTSGTTGKMQFTEWNSNIRISEVIAPGIVFNGTGYFNAHWWDGPGGLPLPGQVDEISSDLELGFFNGGPWSGQIAFHPQFVDSYESVIDSKAFNFDGRVIATYRASPNWSFVGGVAFWDRVDLLVVPHVGVIWAPDPHWELRLLYPKSRISYYLGRWDTTDVWAYGSYEYTAESWGVDIGSTSQYRDRMQITEDQLAVGLRWDSGRWSFFAETGYVFNRQIKFQGPTPDFNLGNVEMFRIGMRY